MDGSADQSLTIAARAGARFDLARDSDEPEIRRVLRENPMGGAIRLSFEREPDARLAAKIEGPLLHQTIVGRRDDGRLFGIGTRSVRMAYVNGQPMPLGYLGALRLDQDVRSTPRLIQAGYRKLRELHEADRATPIYFTSIMADNVPARRILEANLKDMPTYRFVAEFVTLIFRPRRKSNSHARTVDQAEILSLLADRRDQFAPVWNSESLHSLAACGLDARAFRVIHSGGTPIACAAAWDTSSFKQSVVRGYSSAMRWARRFSKLPGSFTSAPRLPKIGAPLRLTYLSHVCVPADRAEMLIPLVESLDVGGVLVAGFDARDPRLDVLRRAFGGRELRSRLYVVHWADGRAIAESLEKRGRESFLKKDSRPLFFLPEVALL